MIYSVQIQNTPYTTKNNLVLPQTAEVTILCEDGADILQFGVAEIEHLKNLSCEPMEFCELYFHPFHIKIWQDLLQPYDESSVTGFYADKCFFDGDTDFSDYTYGEGGFRLTNCYFGNGIVSFRGTTFLSDTVDFSANLYGNGCKDFSYSRFIGREIQFFSSHFNDGDVDFKFSRFEKGHLNFSGSDFGYGEITFDYSIFGRAGADFGGIDFGKGYTSFRNSHFLGGTAIFFGSHFREGKLSFSDADFGNSDVDFSFCCFEDCVVHFKYAKMRKGSFHMSNATLTGGYLLFKSFVFRCKSILFRESSMERLIFLNCIFLEHADMRLKQSDEFIVENCIIEKTFDLTSSNQFPVEIRTLNLIHTKNLGRIYVDWIMNDVKNTIYSQGSKTTHLDKASQFLLLKENFHEIGHYDDEDSAYVEYKRCKTASELKGEDLSHGKNKKATLFYRYITFPIKWLVFDFTGRYATNPIRVLGVMLMTMLLFTGVYTLPFIELSGEKNFYENQALNKYATSLYHSIQSMFTLGFGDINPDNLITLLVSGTESFIGLFLMSYFTVSFMRKILR